MKDSALVEEYIEGREFYVGVLGNREPVAFPPIEMDFSGLPEGMPHVAGTKAKWKKNSVEYKGTKSVLADIPDELRAKLQKAAVDAYRALRVRDYGRVDLRLTETGEIYVIEVNASCYLEAESEFAMAAQGDGHRVSGAGAADRGSGGGAVQLAHSLGPSRGSCARGRAPRPHPRKGTAGSRGDNAPGSDGLSGLRQASCFEPECRCPAVP